MAHFPISGIDTYWWLPVVTAFAISCFTSMGGVSGAFLLLPFQISILGFSGPGVSATNLLYNVVAIPGGVWRFYRKKRIVWPLAAVIILASLPSTFLGAVIRVKYLAGERAFKVFAALFLLYIAGRLGMGLRQRLRRKDAPRSVGTFQVVARSFSLRQIEYEFNGVSHTASTWKLFSILFLFGVAAGAYGVGGGALVAPLLVAVFHLPVHSIAGATLLATFVASLGGVGFYALLSLWMAGVGPPIAPDWMLGVLFGLGGMAGIQTGAWLQPYVPAWIIELILMAMTVFIAATYLF